MLDIKEDTKINIIFRACDVVNAVHNAPRPFGLDKKTLIKVCFKSLYDSAKDFNCRITILGDKLSKEMTAFFEEYNVDIIHGIFGNDNSIRESIKIAQQFHDDEWVYFCEDDYLHQRDTFEKIIALINQKEVIIPGNIRWKQLLRKREITLFSIPRFFNKPNIIIHPCDYPDRYDFQYQAKNFIFHTTNSHWRQVSDTTFTFLMQVKDVKKKQAILMRSANRANDRYLSRKLFGKSFFYRKLLCVSPMPSLTSHMHVETMSPLMDCQFLVEKLMKEI